MQEALKVAVQAVDDKKGIDVVALDISTVASFADYFLLCTGESSRQIHAIADEIEQRLAAHGLRPTHVEGYTNAEWVLMDYVDLVIHIFSPQARAHYDLERLWRDGKPLDLTRLGERKAERSSPRRAPRKESK